MVVSQKRQLSFVSGKIVRRIMGQDFEGDFWKYENEKLRIFHDFGPNLEDGENEEVAVPSVTITDLSDGSDVTATMLMTSSLGFTSNRVYYSVQGGTVSKKYKVLIQATTDLSIGDANKLLKARHLIQVRAE